MGQYGPKNTSFLRGWQRSSEHGTVDFDANYPGHYRLRTTHTHVVVRENNGHAAHVGMLYFDDKLDEVIQVVVSILALETEMLT
jgi:protocatechuate 3,4-dioxygenase beta subunit